MIEGFKLTIPGTVVKGWLDAAHARHAEKAAGYKASLDNLPVNERPDYSSGDPFSGLKSKILDHTTKARWFEMASKYVDVTETYRLSSYELRELEVDE